MIHLHNKVYSIFNRQSWRYKGLFGGGKAAVNTAPAEAVVEEAKKSSEKNRSSLFSTPGAIMGQELNPDQTKKRDTLFGN